MEHLTLDTLWIVLGLFAGIAAHIIKKVITYRAEDAEFGLKRFLKENPYKTAMTFFYAGAGLVGLYAVGDVSIYTAILTGFSANSLSGASEK